LRALARADLTRAEALAQRSSSLAPTQRASRHLTKDMGVDGLGNVVGEGLMQGAFSRYLR